MEKDEEVFLVILTFIIFCSVFLNSTALLTFYVKRKNLDFKDNVMISLAIADLLRSILGYMIHNLIFADSLKNYAIIILHIAAYFTTFLAYASIAHITVLVFDVYLNICRPFTAERLHLRTRNAVWICLISWLYGAIWAVLPFTGISEYDTNRFGGSINWRLQTKSNKIYISLLFLFFYAKPVITMLVLYPLTMRGMSKMIINARKFTRRNSLMERDAIDSRRSIRKIVSIMLLSLIIAWSPYAIICLFQFFKPSSKIGGGAEVLIMLFAKSSTIFNPVIYVICYRDFRMKLKELLKKLLTGCRHYRRSTSDGIQRESSLRSTERSSETLSLTDRSSEGPAEKSIDGITVKSPEAVTEV